MGGWEEVGEFEEPGAVSCSNVCDAEGSGFGAGAGGGDWDLGVEGVAELILPDPVLEVESVGAVNFLSRWV